MPDLLPWSGDRARLGRAAGYPLGFLKVSKGKTRRAAGLPSLLIAPQGCLGGGFWAGWKTKPGQL